LVNYQIEAFGKKAILDSKEYTLFRADSQIQSSDNIIDQLKSIIKITGGSEERVRILPLSDTGEADLGYQFLEPEENTGIGILPSEGYFDVDLKVPSDIVNLHHIVNLLHTGKFAMVMKQADGTLNDGKMICAFNRDRFLRPQDIYSVGESTSLEITSIAEFINYRVVINEYVTAFRPTDSDSQIWRNTWSYPRAWSSDLKTQNSDLLSYLHYLQDNTQDSSYINSFIRYYMERIELRIENFYTNLRAILR
jgi:hypothetical protein